MSGTNAVLAEERARWKPSPAQHAWLRRGLMQPGGRLALFDKNGRRVPTSTIRRCLDAGWAEPWFSNPIKPDWLVCKLTDTRRALMSKRQTSQSSPIWPTIVRETGKSKI